MTDHDRPAFAEAMVVLGHTFNETISPIRIGAYGDALRLTTASRMCCGQPRPLFEPRDTFPSRSNSSK